MTNIPTSGGCWLQSSSIHLDNEFDTGDLFMNRENLRGKTLPDEFKVITPENPLLSKQAVTSKGISVPLY